MEKKNTKKITMELPDVEDIPGQENIHPPKMNAFADTTISSDDEEGKGIEGLDDDLENDDADADISAIEAEDLEDAANSTSGPDDLAQKRARLDNVDNDGEPLNESIDDSGIDLDVPGSEEDDENEEIGEEDEENNSYSVSDN